MYNLSTVAKNAFDVIEFATTSREICGNRDGRFVAPCHCFWRISPVDPKFQKNAHLGDGFGGQFFKLLNYQLQLSYLTIFVDGQTIYQTQFIANLQIGAHVGIESDRL